MINISYIFFCHILKPIYLIYFYYNIYFSEKIYLTNKNYLSKGRFKKVFIHPNDNNKCIKVLHQKNGLWDIINEEFRFFIINEKTNNLPFFYQVIQTNLGNGLVFELIRDYNGKLSLTLNEYIEILKNKDDNFKKNFIFNFEKFTFNHINKYLSNYQHFNNIMIKFINDNEYRFIVIDDYDYNNKYYLNSEYIKKDVLRFVNKLKNKLSD